MTIPPYNPLVPQSDNTIADGQPDFLQNFGQLFNAFNLNHISLNDPTNPGNHNVIQLVEQAQARATFSQEISIYSKLVANQTDQLFMRYPNNGKEFQLTQFQIYSIAPTPQQEAYFTFLPGGIIVYFGRVIAFGAKTVNINLNPAICTNIMGVNLGGIVTAQAQPNVSLTAQTPTNVVILSSVASMADQYYLIFGNV